MDLADKVAEFKTRTERQKTSVKRGEATKTEFVLPFLQSLGYDIFNPIKVVPECTADNGMKKGEGGLRHFAGLFNNHSPSSMKPLVPIRKSNAFESGIASF